MLNEKLLKTALIGTAQSAPSPLDVDEEVEFADHSFDELSDESQFLLRLGRHTIYQAAGQIPQQIPALPTAPESEQVAWSDSMLNVFDKVMQPELHALLPEFLSSFAGHRLLVPGKIVPTLLDIRPSVPTSTLLEVIGPRGEWIRRFNSAWDWLDENSNSEINDVGQLTVIWNEGTFEERLRAIKFIRRVSPETARDLLAASFKKEKADNRKQLMSIFENELCEADAAFLENCLTDLSKFVKQIAANLLGRLAGSAIHQRNLQRAKQMLQKQNQSPSLKLTCTPPKAIADGWEEDGLAAKPPSPRGQRAYWAEELVSKIPLDFWCEYFAAKPVQLINSVLNDDYAHAVISGWTKALHAQINSSESVSWSESLWKYWSAMLQHPQQSVVIQATEQLGNLAKKIPSEKLEHLVLQIIGEQHAPTNLPIVEVMNWVPGTWSKKISHEYLKISRTLTATRSDRAVYNWLQSLSVAAVHLSPELFEAGLTPWKIRDHDVSAWQIAGVEKLVTDFQERIRLRHQFYVELKTLVQ